jgi:hypothetical protein
MSELSVELRRDGVSEWLVDAVAKIARGGPDVIGGLLVAVGDPITHEGTRTTSRTHFVERDGNGRPRIDALAERLTQKVMDYCIPRSRINEAIEEMRLTKSSAAFVRLTVEARSLFVTMKNSGEGGELLLYLLLEEVLGIPQILCKMPLKTNTQMHYHGTDGIHAKVLENGNLALYWGEAKIHATVTSAIDTCFASIAPFLTDGVVGSASRDLLLLRDNLDAGTEELTAALVRYFEEGPGRFQAVSATSSLSFSTGLRNPRVLRGRSFKLS